MHFGAPWFLWCLALLPGLALLAWGALAVRNRRLAQFASNAILPKLLLGASSTRTLLLATLRIAAIGFVVLALARPQWGRKDELVVRKGVDIALALDLSASMLAEDVAPNRIEAARAEAVSLLHALTGDRVALVTFGGRASTVCPLTLDYGAVRLFLDAADPTFSPGAGTDIGRAIGEAAKILDAAGAGERRYKTIVLLTDGEDLEEGVADAVKKARDSGIVIHAIGIGTPRGGPIPLRDEAARLTGYKKDREGKVVTTRFDAATLEKIALGTDGIFLHAGPAGDEGARVALAISQMEKREIASRLATRFEDRYQLPLGVALLLLLAEAVWIPRRAKAAMNDPSGPEPGRGSRASGRSGEQRVARAATASAVVLALVLGGGARVALAAPEGDPDRGASADSPPPAGKAQVSIPAGQAPSASVARKNREGNKLYAGKQYPEALSTYEAAGAAVPELPALRYNMGNVLVREGKLDEAASEYQRALRSASPEIAPAIRYNLGNTQFLKGSFKDAVESYRRVLEKAPNDEAARRNLELALRALKQAQQQQQQQQQQDSKDPHQNKDDQKGTSQEQQQTGAKKEEPSPGQKEGEPSQSAQDQEGQGSAQGPEKDPSEAKAQKAGAGEKGKIGKKEAESLLDSLSEEEKRDLKRRQARKPREDNVEKDW